MRRGPRLKPIATLAIALLMALLAAGAAGAAPPALRRGINFELWQTWTDRATFLAADYDRGNFPDWSRAVSDDQLASLRHQGFDFVRLNINSSAMLWDDAGADALINRTVATTERLQAAGFAVIVDLHTTPDQPDRPDGVDSILGTDGHAPQDFERYLALVARVATALAPLPADKTVLEPINEPEQDWTSRLVLLDKWPVQLAALYKAARTAAPDLALVLTGARGGDIDGLLRLDPAPYAADANIVWSFHFYEPYEITHSGLSWTRDAGHFLVGVPFPASAIDDTVAAALLEEAGTRIVIEIADPEAQRKLEAEVAARLDAYRRSGASAETIHAAIRRVADWADRHAIPPERIMMGEFGVYQDQAAPETRAAWLMATREAAEAEGFSWAVFCAGLTNPGKAFAVIAEAATLGLAPRIAGALGLAPP